MTDRRAKSAAALAAMNTQDALRERLHQRRIRAIDQRDWDAYHLLCAIDDHDFDPPCVRCGSLDTYRCTDEVHRCLSCREERANG